MKFINNISLEINAVEDYCDLVDASEYEREMIVRIFNACSERADFIKSLREFGPTRKFVQFEQAIVEEVENKVFGIALNCMYSEQVIVSAKRILSAVEEAEKEMRWEATTDLSKACNRHNCDLNLQWPGDGEEQTEARAQFWAVYNKRNSMNFAKTYCTRVLQSDMSLLKKKAELNTAYNFILHYT